MYWLPRLPTAYVSFTFFDVSKFIVENNEDALARVKLLYMTLEKKVDAQGYLVNDSNRKKEDRQREIWGLKRFGTSEAQVGNRIGEGISL
jgi:hypothetical protein